MKHHEVLQMLKIISPEGKDLGTKIEEDLQEMRWLLYLILIGMYVLVGIVLFKQ